jgi:outer membrane protein OmpA-like peptidoglycan-associated protein
MLENPQIKVGVESAPGIELAAERAEAIVGWLVDQGGVSVSRLRTTESAKRRESSGQAGGCWHIRFNVLAEIKISDRLEFDGGNSALREASKETLRAVGKVLMTRRDVGRLTIEGHTCSDGPEHWNVQLSRERAQAVRDFLVGECGVGRDRLDMVGHGPKKPLTESYTARRQNRRVEFLVL